MPAVYAIDLIAKRDKKMKMDRSIIKGWNVHYQTLEEVEEAARAKKREEEEEARKNARKHTQDLQDYDPDQNYDENEKELLTKDAYNPKTGSYSGHYGKKPVKDEGQKQQIHAILNEKPEPFEYAMSTLQSQDNSSNG